MLLPLAVLVAAAASQAASESSGGQERAELEERLTGPQKTRTALVIVHLSSFDAYADQAEDMGDDLARGLIYVFEHDRDLLIILDQGREPESRNMKAIRESLDDRIGRGLPTIIEWHDENCEIEDLPEPFDDPWEWLEMWLPPLLKKNGVTKVLVGGVWWYRDDSSGCVNHVEKILREWTVGKGGFLESVTVDRGLVGEDEAGDPQ